MSEARIGRISNENSTAGPIISGITTFSGQNYFVPPRGTTAERPSNCPPGSIRFNTDSAKLEYFDGLQWLEMEAFNNELGVSGALGNRGVFGGGFTPGATNVIDYITISSTGNAVDFGDLLTSYRSSGQCSSSTRGLFAGGTSVPAGADRNNIEFITISSTGNSTDFSGTITVIRHNIAAFASSTRGLFCGGTGSVPASNVIDYVTIASLGNAVDFGDANASDQGMSGCSNTTRGVFGAGVSNGAQLNFVTISTLGNSATFGTLSIDSSHSRGCCSNSIRGLFAGGSSNGNTIEYITISTLGNSIDFGDLTVGTRAGVSASSSPTRGCFAGGGNPVATNTIDYVTIMSTGNAIDFGDLTVARSYGYGSISNGHGGL